MWHWDACFLIKGPLSFLSFSSACIIWDLAWPPSDKWEKLYYSKFARYLTYQFADSRANFGETIFRYISFTANYCGMNLVAPYPRVQQRYKVGAPSFSAKRVRHFAVSAVGARRPWWSARWSCGSRPREFFFGEGSLRGRHLLGRIGNPPEFCSSR